MKENVELRIPRVGERLMRIMTSTPMLSRDDKPEPCVVVYVNRPHYYYTVQFVDTGLKESYKVPEVDELKQFKDDYHKFFNKKPKGVYVYESGALYPSITECAKAIGVSSSMISRHVHGLSSNVKGYHIYNL